MEPSVHWLAVAAALPSRPPANNALFRAAVAWAIPQVYTTAVLEALMLTLLQDSSHLRDHSDRTDHPDAQLRMTCRP